MTILKQKKKSCQELVSQLTVKNYVINAVPIQFTYNVKPSGMHTR